jgi:exodeoxyribonuclease-5
VSEFVPSAGQQAAHDMIGPFLKQDVHRVAVITGYAGVGKTTLIKYIAKSYGEPKVLTPTGKAALRVGEATGIFGQTIHRFLYVPSEDPRTGAPTFRLKDSWDETFSGMKGQLVLVDEASMVSREVFNDLLAIANKAGFYILLMGDLFQLPPVFKDKQGNLWSALSYETPFRVNLTEVIRQALDSPIIRSSMLLRTGKPEYEAMALLEPVGASKLIESAIETRQRGGVVVCYTNQRRHQINNAVRDALGYAVGSVVAGEPLLVVQNNYVLNVYNGEVVDFFGWKSESCEPFPVTDRYSASSVNMGFGVSEMNGMKVTVSPEQVTGHAENAKVGYSAIRKAARGWYRHKFDAALAPPHLDANYGYALTTHKAQGSEWPEILVVVEPALSRLHEVERNRWLYTAETRAKVRVRYTYVD